MPINDPIGFNEESIINAMVAAMITQQEKRHKAGTLARRFLHGKSLGFAKAVFTVNELPEELRVGLFAYPKDYRAAVRFSNGSFSEKAWDAMPNVRGIGVKIFDVPGPKMLPGEESSRELDFAFANDQTFFAARIEEMLQLVQGKFLDVLLKSPGTIFRALAASNKLVSSVLDIDYFSQVPYRFGDRACKFSFTHDGQPENFPNIFDRDYLRHSMEKQLRSEPYSFTFNVQFQKKGESISDSTKRWTGEFIPLGELRLLQINQKINESDGENLHFNPFRTLFEHEPVGWPGRARKAAYAADFEWRQRINKQELGQGDRALTASS